jgi:hypothetical protein
MSRFAIVGVLAAAMLLLWAWPGRRHPEETFG